MAFIRREMLRAPGRRFGEAVFGCVKIDHEIAERAFESTRGSYEGNRTGYIELLDSARRMLRARLRLVDTRKEFAHARAQLLHFVGIRTARKEESK